LRALQRTQNTPNVYYNFRSPKAIRLYEDIAPTASFAPYHEHEGSGRIEEHDYFTPLFLSQEAIPARNLFTL